MLSREIFPWTHRPVEVCLDYFISSKGCNRNFDVPFECAADKFLKEFNIRDVFPNVTRCNILRFYIFRP